MRHRFAFLPLLSVALLFGCREAKVTSYRIPKEKPDELPAAAAPNGSGSDMANTAVPTANGSDLTWSAPAAWKAKAPGAMRKGSFSVAGENGEEADLSITAFPGDVGGELANLNRWRGQIQLGPLQESDLASAVTRSEHDGLTFVVVDFANTAASPRRILGAIVPYNGATWFFKLTGPDALVAKNKPAFLAFLQTVRPPAAATASAAVAPNAPAPASEMANTAVPTAGGSNLTWTAPAAWEAQALGAMRKGSFAVVGENGEKADLSITAFPGDVGGELANLNRWRGQIQLGPLQESDLANATTRSAHDSLTFVVVDFANTAAASPQRILGAIVPYNGATWFFKLTGPDALVAKNKAAFLAFLQTVRPPAQP